MSTINSIILEAAIMEFEKKDNADIEVNEEKLRKLKYRIYSLERENYKTQKYKYNEMVDKIIKMISQEVDNVN